MENLYHSFGLTGPNNGSDATGNIDQGNVIESGGKIMIDLSLNKRYNISSCC